LKINNLRRTPLASFEVTCAGMTLEERLEALIDNYEDIRCYKEEIRF